MGILLGLPPKACEQRGVCGMQTVVEADGSVYPCDFFALDEYRLGNLNEDRFEDILHSPVAAAFRRRSAAHAAQCCGCRWYALCRGGCYRNRMGEPDGINYLCKGYRMFFEARHRALKRVAVRLSSAAGRDR